MSLRQRNKARVRAAILTAASELIADQGVEQVTTRAIASAAGISYQTLYNYFPTKALILRGLLEDDMQRWSDGVDLAIKHFDGDVIGTLTEVYRVGIALVTESEETRRLWQTLASSMLNQDVLPDYIVTVKTVAHDQFYALLKLAQGTGHVAPTLDLHLMAHTLFCLSDYALLQFFLLSVEPEAFLRTQREQLQLVVGPYLTTPSR